MAKSLKFGYEGEGPMIGRRTIYASYPEVAPQLAADAANEVNVDSIYFVIDDEHRHFVESLFLAVLGKIKVVTLDFPVDAYPCYSRCSSFIRFIRCNHETNVDLVPASAAGVNHTYIKMVCEDGWLMKDFAVKANEIAELGHTVLLMPDFWKDSPILLGQEMMKHFHHLHPRVRVCPPVHHVLGTP